MSRLPDKPTGCIIEEEVDSIGVTLRWPLASSGVSRFGAAAFLVFWLCGWTVAGITTIITVVAGIVGGGGPQCFVLAWLGGWACGECFAIAALWGLLRPSRPESVRLHAESLRYNPGRSPMHFSQEKGEWQWNMESVNVRTRPVELLRTEIPAFVLDRIGERQRLYFDNGADRVEIGATLREPEREWLFAVLQKWHSPSM